MECRVARSFGAVLATAVLATVVLATAVLATASHQLRYVKGFSLALKHLIVRGKSSSTLVDFRKSWIFSGFSDFLPRGKLG